MIPEEICRRIEATGAAAEVRSEAAERVQAAKSRLAGAGLDPDEGRAFELVAEGVVERYS